jgi:hypothetical protein
VPPVGPHLPELWHVAGHNQVKGDYIIKEVPCLLILDTTQIVYPYESTDVFRNGSHYTVWIPSQALIGNWCRHCCPRSYLPLPVAGAPWWQHSEFKLKSHPRNWNNDSVACSRRQLSVNIHSWVAYRVSFGTRCTVLCK